MIKINRIALGLVALFIMSTPIFGVSSFISDDQLIFESGCGWEDIDAIPTGNGSPADDDFVQFLCKVQLGNGVIIDDFGDQVQEFVDLLIRGSVQAFGGNAPLPNGNDWLLCDGTLYNTLSTPTLLKLAKLIVDTYCRPSDTCGSIIGDDFIGDFRVPNLSTPNIGGLFIRGLSDIGSGNSTIDPDGATRSLGDFQAFATKRPTVLQVLTSIDTHDNHTFTDVFWLDNDEGNDNTGSFRGSSGAIDSDNQRKFSATNDLETVSHSHGPTTISAGGDLETRPPNFPVKYYIKI